ncbi:hypothetical protein N798_01925 [Knoellia flava TL1]|uniref:Uncharacterized protein n=2 Tax=Knoellia flava TaxID=913969 RepID=A0A8H9FS21_9MICO|nr:hypothetical protein [Knoellia flava]KGN35658.1 hypothetical protein N798_01925 [Knoellia flava TL1]GGB76322.1 hypothetical protein GCM10011314_14850 [Knoellia flava]
MTSAASAASVESDRERLADTVHVLHGPSGSPARKEVAYAAYVAFILVGLYGFPVLRALVIAGDRGGMADALRSPWAVLVALLGLAAAALVAREAGRVRGPVVAPVPWVDLVVVSSVDRWAALRPWFGYALFAVLAGGAMAGVLVAASLWGAGVAPVWVAAPGVVLGLVAGLVVGAAWLVGQSRLSPPLPPSCGKGTSEGAGGRRKRPLSARSAWWKREVRRLGIAELRIQSARSGRIVGGVQAGDLRSVRLEAARPVTRGRSHRLRHRGPVLTLVARDVLGLRRAPASAIVGLLVTAASAWALGATLASDAVPPLVAFVAALCSHVGFSALSEGLRLEADTMGTPALFGSPPVRAAATHLLVPGGLHLVVTTVVGCIAAALLGGTVGGALPGLVMATLVLSGGMLLAAYRGRPPTSRFNAVPSAQGVLVWFAMPLILDTLLVGGMVWGITRWPTSGLIVIGSWVAAAVMLYAGLNRVQSESLAHRDV